MNHPSYTVSANSVVAFAIAQLSQIIGDEKVAKGWRPHHCWSAGPEYTCELSVSDFIPLSHPVDIGTMVVVLLPMFIIPARPSSLSLVHPFKCLLLYSQNIIKKVIGQKFVYKFVSFPDILKMDPHAVEISRESLLLQDSDCKVSPEGREAHRHGLSALKSTSRNEYIHSGLYSSFTINSLQNPPEAFKAIKTEKLEEPCDDSPPVEQVRTVIRFVTNKTDKHTTRPVVSLPSTSEAAAAASAFLASSVSAKISSLMLPNAASVSSASPSSSRSPSLSPNSPLPSEHRSLFLEAACHDSDSLEPLNLSSGSKTKSPSLPPKGKKPKGLEISAPQLLLSGTDIGSIALNSPALPSGSLTPAFFTAQVNAVPVILVGSRKNHPHSPQDKSLGQCPNVTVYTERHTPGKAWYPGNRGTFALCDPE